MQNILVTGAAGYVGSKVCYDLIDKNFKVLAIDDLSLGNRSILPKKCIFIKVDISKLEELERVFKKFKFTTVYHFAAKKSVDESQRYPLKYFKTNVMGTKNLLDLIIKYGVKNLIFSSTCAVYGETLNHEVSEKNLLVPKSYYGYTKFLCEKTIIQYQKKYNFNYAILRYFNVVGADHKLRTGEIDSDSLFKNIIVSIKTGKAFNLYGDNYNTKDGTCIRDYIDINDLSELHLLALNKIKKLKKSIIFNCGYNKPRSVSDIVHNFEKILKFKIPIKLKKKRKGDVEEIYSNNKVQNNLFPNWRPKFNLSDSIKLSLRWEKVNFLK
jgi:UDP-glucose 4-epimerase